MLTLNFVSDTKKMTSPEPEIIAKMSSLLSVSNDARGGPASPSKDKEGALKKWLDRLADALKRLAGKAIETLPAIVGSVVGAILSFLGKAVGFVAEHSWALIAFVVGFIATWLMQRAKKG